MNLQEIKELIKIIDETEISELSLESDGVKIAIRKGSSLAAGVPVSATARQEVRAPIANPAVRVSPNVETVIANAPEPVEKANTEIISAPMVGTFYSSQSPDADPFVKIGQTVEVGQTVCIVEAMKLMNEIESEFKGKVIQILVENGQPVEYGQPLFILEK